jgi:hypothetical protein
MDCMICSSNSNRSNRFSLLLNLQPASGAHPDSYEMVTVRLFPVWLKFWGVKLTTLHLLVTLRISGAIPTPLVSPQGVGRNNVTFTIYNTYGPSMSTKAVMIQTYSGDT